MGIILKLKMNQSSKMLAIAPMQMRRLMKFSATAQATRTGMWAQFRYPHSHSGTNNAFNYMSEGYLLLTFGVLTLFGYSYMNDIKEQKGRRVRRKFISELETDKERR